MNAARRSLLSRFAVFAATAASTPVALAGTGGPLDLGGALDKALKGDGVLRLGAGTFVAQGLRIAAPLRIEGIAGKTRIVAGDGGPVLIVENTADVSISGISFAGDPSLASDAPALVAVRNVKDLAIADCRFADGPGTGLRLEGCSGRVRSSRFARLGQTALFALDSKGLQIAGNDVEDIGNNGIQVWTSAPAEDGTLVTGNRVAQIAAKEGGTGQNGNGINVFRAGNVTVAGNRITDCAFSAVRNNSGANCQIVNNSISRTSEVAIYSEFAFEGAIIAGNLIDDVSLGISITNFKEGGRLAVCANNLVRRCRGGGSIADKSATGIFAEADTTVTGNVVEDAADFGIVLGVGPYCRNLMASGNLVRACGTGIAFSASEGAEPVMISHNRIAGSKRVAIVALDHGRAVSGDLGADGATVPAGASIAGNLVS